MNDDEDNFDQNTLQKRIDALCAEANELIEDAGSSRDLERAAGKLHRAMNDARNGKLEKDMPRIAGIMRANAMTYTQMKIAGQMRPEDSLNNGVAAALVSRFSPHDGTFYEDHSEAYKAAVYIIRGSTKAGKDAMLQAIYTVAGEYFTGPKAVEQAKAFLTRGNRAQKLENGAYEKKVRRLRFMTDRDTMTEHCLDQVGLIALHDWVFSEPAPGRPNLKAIEGGKTDDKPKPKG